MAPEAGALHRSCLASSAVRGSLGGVWRARGVCGLADLLAGATQSPCRWMLADERVNALSALEYWPAGPAPRYDEQTRDSVAQLEPVCLLMLRQLAAASPRIFSAS